MFLYHCRLCKFAEEDGDATGTGDAHERGRCPVDGWHPCTPLQSVPGTRQGDSHTGNEVKVQSESASRNPTYCWFGSGKVDLMAFMVHAGITTWTFLPRNTQHQRTNWRYAVYLSRLESVYKICLCAIKSNVNLLNKLTILCENLRNKLTIIQTCIS